MRGARRAAASLAAAALALALVAGCGGGGGDDEQTQASAPLFDGPPVVVSVIDGDTRAPVAGVEVSGLRGGAVIARATSDAAGRTTLPLGVGVVTAHPRPYSPARVRVRDGAADVALYDPRLQSPQYGGGPDRDRYVPGAGRGPRAAHRRWRFESRTLLEFPPAVRDGLVVVGNNAGRVYALDTGDGRLRWARRQKGEIAATPAITQDAIFMASMDGSLVALRPGGHPALDLLQLGQPHRELAAGGGRPGLRGGARRRASSPLTHGRGGRAGPSRRPPPSRAAPRWPAGSWWWATTRGGCTRWTPGPAPSGGPPPAACGSTGGPP